MGCPQEPRLGPTWCPLGRLRERGKGQSQRACRLVDGCDEADVVAPGHDDTFPADAKVPTDQDSMQLRYRMEMARTVGPPSRRPSRTSCRATGVPGSTKVERPPTGVESGRVLDRCTAIEPSRRSCWQRGGYARAIEPPLLPSERAERERRRADVRARHPGSEFNRAFAVGRALTRNGAIQSALALQQGS